MGSERPPVLPAAEDVPQEALTRQDRTPIKMGARGLAFETASEVYALARALVRGGVTPKGMTEGGAMAAILRGRALGLDEITSVTNITVVNGVTSIKGAALLALIQRSKAAAEFDYGWEGDGPTREAWVKARRHDETKPRVHRFGMPDAVRGKLSGKESYQQWPDDMLLWRAVSRCARRQFADVTMGIYVTGEVPDSAAVVVVGSEPEPPELPPAPDPLFADGGD